MSRNVLCICAHPDDEVLGCGGTIARHVAAGDRVGVLILTDGVQSRGLETELMDERAEMARVAASILGCDVSFGLNGQKPFRDQRLDAHPILEVARAIEHFVRGSDHFHHPQIVYTHWKGDLNVDHRMTAHAVLTAFRPMPGSTVEAIYGFEVPSSTEWGLEPFVPDYFVPIYGEPSAKKRDALKAYEAEMRHYPHPRSMDGINSMELVRGMSAGVQRAEAFRTYRRIERA